MIRNSFCVLILLMLASSAFSGNLGQATYEIACKNCHSPTLSKGMHAPAAFDVKAWKIRFKHAKFEALQNPKQFNKAIDYLLYSVKIGKGLMHHGGLCHEADVPNKNCSDEALIEAILYMSQKS
jgi:cytochrome c5